MSSKKKSKRRPPPPPPLPTDNTYDSGGYFGTAHPQYYEEVAQRPLPPVPGPEPEPEQGSLVHPVDEDGYTGQAAEDVRPPAKLPPYMASWNPDRRGQGYTTPFSRTLVDVVVRLWHLHDAASSIATMYVLNSLTLSPFGERRPETQLEQAMCMDLGRAVKNVLRECSRVSDKASAVKRAVATCRALLAFIAKCVASVKGRLAETELRGAQVCPLTEMIEAAEEDVDRARGLMTILVSHQEGDTETCM